MGRPRKWDSDAERMAAKRRREDELAAAARAHWSAADLTRAARAGRVTLTPAEEQRIRDEMGYALSETRTLAERDAAAARMVESIGSRPFSRTAFPHVVGRDDPGSWSLEGKPDPKANQK